MAPFASNKIYRFEGYELNLRTGDLVRNGHRIHLQEKLRILLIALIQRQGDTVLRADLHKSLWPDETFVDFEDGLNTAIKKLREILGDDTQTSRFIETVRGRGYRFIATIVHVELSELALPPQTDQLSVAPLVPANALSSTILYKQKTFKPHFKRKHLYQIAGTALIIFAITFIIHLFTRQISIAVLPIVNMTGNTEREYICIGITEELINRLGRYDSSQLRVIAPTSARTYTNTSKTAKQIGSELNVQYLVQGSLQQDGLKYRLLIQLIRVDDQAHLWSSDFDTDLNDKFAFESNVANSVGHALLLRIPSLKGNDYQPGKFEAHDAYLKGIYFMSLRSKYGLEKSVKNLSNAVAIDNHYADAYALLASDYNLMGQYGWMETDAARNLGWAAAQQALAIDPNLVEAHNALGFSYWYYQWDMSKAESEFRASLKIEPGNVNSNHWMGMLLLSEARYDEAEKYFKLALNNDPRSAIIRTNYAWLHYYQGRYAQARQELNDVLAEYPDFPGAHYKLWFTYSMLGDRDNAWHEFQWYASQQPDPGEMKRVQTAYEISGYIAALRAYSQSGSLDDSAVPRAYIFAGNSEAAIDFLEHAYLTHQPWLVFIPNDPAFVPLRNDQRFHQLMSITQHGQ